MTAVPEPIHTIVGFLSFNGRIPRLAYFFFYLVPAALIVFVAEFFGIPALPYLSLWLLVAGTRKRLNDTALKLGGGTKVAMMVVWGIAIVAASVVAFVYFLGGISGGGNIGMLESAVLIFGGAIVLPVFGLILIALVMPGTSTGNDHGAAPVPSDSTATVRKAAKVGLIGLAAVIVLIGTGAALLQVYIYFAERQPPVIQAIRDQDTGALEALLLEGADANQLSSFGATALMTALNRGQPASDEMAMLLLEHGADPNMNSGYGYHRDDIGTMHTPLITAIQWGTSELLFQTMLTKGANPNPQQANEEELAPLVEAVLSRRVELVKLLLENGADVNAAPNREALPIAVRDPMDFMVEALLTRDVSLEQLTTAIEWVEASIAADGCRPSMATIRQRLKAAANEAAGEQRYALDHYFREPPETVQSATSFEQRFISKPILAVPVFSSDTPSPVRAGPNNSYDILARLDGGTPVDILAMTDQDYYKFRWFYVRYGNGRTGYMTGDELDFKSICVEGMLAR